MHFEVSSNPRNDGCIPSIELGEKCLKDYECVAENSRCIDICSCKVDHVLSKDGKQCLKVRNSVGESCQENSQCQLGIKDSECGSDGKCSCIENFHQRGSVCFRDMMLNDRCQSHRDCVTVTYKHSNITEVMNVDCIDNTCVCAKDYIMSKELYDCIRYSDNGAESTISWQQIFPWLYNFFLRILPWNEITKKIVKLTTETIEYRNKNNIVRSDFINVLLNLKKHPEKIAEIELTNDLLSAQTFVFFGAGFETSSTTISNALYELALNHDIQYKLREEIKEFEKKNDGKWTYESIKEMQYLNKIFQETLRKYPVVPFLNRELISDYTKKW